MRQHRFPGIQTFIYFFGITVFSYMALGFSRLGFARPGQTDVIINRYALLRTDAKKGDSRIEIQSSLDPNIPAITDIKEGDLLLLVQMQGAQINIPADVNDPHYGEISDLQGAGSYEFVKVGSYLKDGNGGGIIELDGTCQGLQHNYSKAAHTQVILVPQSANFLIDSSQNVTTPAWNGEVGGIVALKTDSLTIHGTIDVSSRGFRGGMVDERDDGDSELKQTILYYSNTPRDGGSKGESIGGSCVDYQTMGGCYGRGSIANGGGGGNNHNASGGGGANACTKSPWNGQGVMDPNYINAWKLDPAYVQYHGLTTSCGGGRGGYSFSDRNRDPFSVAPGNANWWGNHREEVGGLGGRPLPYSGNLDQIFFGGGGGSGHANSGTGGGGGTGGGAIIIVANQINGSGMMIADGGAGEISQTQDKTQWYDGTGGGGGGGSVILFSNEVKGVGIRAQGGIGGNQLVSSNSDHKDEAEGGGGGGGGGFVAVANGNPVIANISAGSAGTTTSHPMAKFPVNGGTAGSEGVVDYRSDLNGKNILLCVPPVFDPGAPPKQVFQLSGGGFSGGCSLGKQVSGSEIWPEILGILVSLFIVHRFVIHSRRTLQD